MLLHACMLKPHCNSAVSEQSLIKQNKKGPKSIQAATKTLNTQIHTHTQKKHTHLPKVTCVGVHVALVFCSK